MVKWYIMLREVQQHAQLWPPPIPPRSRSDGGVRLHAVSILTGSDSVQVVGDYILLP